MNIAFFISGRIKFYKNLINFLNNVKKCNKIILFASVNNYSLDDVNDQEEFKQFYKDILGDTYFDFFKIEKDIIEVAKLNNNFTVLKMYNQQSCFWNDKKNFEMIEKYQKDNNINFDIICKIRSDMIFRNFNTNFIKDNSEDKILRYKHLMDIRYWGHVYRNTPTLISDAFCYGNYKSMKIYCNTYEFFKNEYIKSKGIYCPTFELLLTDSLLNYTIVMHYIRNEQLPKNKIFELYNNCGIKFIIDNNFIYNLPDTNIRSSKNFIVDENNYKDYIQL
jgi:hypothetical protein